MMEDATVLHLRRTVRAFQVKTVIITSMARDERPEKLMASVQ
ncbi:hypothetical protein OESDEN_16193 [Oesophagostomum dentatum]|uniref:Uncharacterized protein n=1 Tax=Oesophagostomum dentatum TaxID=61180 RepID=A0A0B1SKS4_OESDE|nr:hypothetical protein OESDEN_16193 [Oesophagostomum dentatum]